jgi:hypothetical protein
MQIRIQNTALWFVEANSKLAHGEVAKKRKIMDKKRPTGKKEKREDDDGIAAVLRIRDVYPGSEFFPSRIPGQKDSRIWIRIRIKEFNYFNPKKCFFLSSRKYDPGCSTRNQTPDLDLDFLPIPDPGSRVQGSKKHRIPDPEHETLLRYRT